MRLMRAIPVSMYGRVPDVGMITSILQHYWQLCENVATLPNLPKR